MSSSLEVLIGYVGGLEADSHMHLAALPNPFIQAALDCSLQFHICFTQSDIRNDRFLWGNL